jgi:epoxyqueuosine reductase
VEVDILILEEVVQAMTGFFKDNPLNVVPELNNLQLYDPPLVAVAAPDDPLFERLKAADAVGPQHMSPQEWLDGSKAVVSYFLPFTPTVRKTNRTLGLPSVEWLYARIEGQTFNAAMSNFLADYFIAAGFRAIVPAVDPRFKVVNRRSNWSERHVAFIAGDRKSVV